MFAKIAGCNDIERFWSKVAKTEASLCWEWNGTKTDTGYGLFRIGSNIDGSRRTERAHRIRLAEDYLPASFWAKITGTSRSAIYHVRNGTSWGDMKSLKQALG